MRARAGTCPAAEPDETPALVVRVDPEDGATGVFRDAPVVARLSHPVDAASVGAPNFRVEDEHGPVPGRYLTSPDLYVVIWFARRPLVAGTLHFVVASGLRDVRGRQVTRHVSRFVPCDLSLEDLSG